MFFFVYKINIVSGFVLMRLTLFAYVILQLCTSFSFKILFKTAENVNGPLAVLLPNVFINVVIGREIDSYSNS